CAFHWHGGHRDLHSFPTRRSSDLGSRPDAVLGIPAGPAEYRLHAPDERPGHPAAGGRRLCAASPATPHRGRGQALGASHRTSRHQPAIGGAARSPDMRTYAAEHIVASIAGALQFVSHHHPPDFVAALQRAYRAESQPAARDALLQLLVNSKLAARATRPVCQDTGVAHVYFELGMDARIDGGGATPTPQALADR